MPIARRHAKRKKATVERRLIEFLKDPTAGDCFFTPEGAPSEWGAVLLRDADNARSATNIICTVRVALDADDSLTTYIAAGIEYYTDEQGRPCGRPVWSPAVR